MSIISRIRPSVQTKPTRVRPVAPVPFGHGILPDARPVKVQDWRVADQAIAEGRASRRPEVTGRGLSRSEVNRILAAENEARYRSESAGDVENVGYLVALAAQDELGAILADRVVAATFPVGFRTLAGQYVPSSAEEAFAVASFATLDRERQDARDEAEFEIFLEERDRFQAMVA